MFPDYVLNDDWEGFEILVDPGRDPTAWCTLRYASGRVGGSWTGRHGLVQYWIMGHRVMFEDENALPEGLHDNADKVAVSAKTMWRHCSSISNLKPGARGNSIMSGAHMDGVNLSFMDGHGRTFNVKPFWEWFIATGGSRHVRHPDPAFGCTGNTAGRYAFTYPPGLNVAGSVAGAEWWIPPSYPDGPIANWP